MSDVGSDLPEWTEPGTQGFVFATTGETYTILARRAARNLRLLMPGCSIDLFTDQPVEDLVFDRIHPLGHSWFRPKMQALRESRFERSIVLDADIIVVADISEVFQLLDRCDIAGVEGVVRSLPMMSSESEVPRCLPPINSGFLAVRASQKLCEFTISWENDVRERASSADQPAFRSHLYHSDLRFLPLGGEYNLIAIGRLDTWGKAAGAPRVLHVPDLHNRPPGNPEVPFSLVEAIGDIRAAHVERLIAADWSLGGDEQNVIVPPAKAQPPLQNSETVPTNRSQPSLLRKVVRRFRRPASAPPPQPPARGGGKGKKSGRYTPYQSAVLALASARDPLRICIVGANDGRFGDPLYALIKNELSASTEIVLFEPQEYLIPYLTNNYAFHPNHKIVKSAIGPLSNLELHAVKPEAWSLLNPEYAKRWPQYRAPTGVTSSAREMVVNWVGNHCPDDTDPESLVTALSVPCAPLVDALSKIEQPPNLDILQIDAEGMDDEVLYACDIEQTSPSIIFLEFNHIPAERLQKLKLYLQKDYSLSDINRDLLAIRRP